MEDGLRELARIERSLGLLLCAAAVALPAGQAAADAYVPSEPTPPVIPIEAATGAAVDNVQQGAVVRGSINVTWASSRLRVDVFTPRSALGGRGPRKVRVGRFTATVAAGDQAFSVELNAAAEGALRGTGRLPVTVRIRVTPPTGTPFKATRKATLILFAT
jgi:hypothetical protein